MVGAHRLVGAAVDLQAAVEEVGFHQAAAAVGAEAADLAVRHLAGREAGHHAVGEAEGGVHVVDRALGAAATVLRGRQWLLVGKVLGPLLILTVIFDNAIIASGIVAYDPNNISGVKIGVAPIEDFAYSIALALLMPTIWIFLEKRNK